MTQQATAGRYRAHWLKRGYKRGARVHYGAFLKDVLYTLADQVSMDGKRHMVCATWDTWGNIVVHIDGIRIVPKTYPNGMTLLGWTTGGDDVTAGNGG